MLEEQVYAVELLILAEVNQTMSIWSYLVQMNTLILLKWLEWKVKYGDTHCMSASKFYFPQERYLLNRLQFFGEAVDGFDRVHFCSTQ